MTTRDDRVARLREELFGQTVTGEEAARILGLEKSTVYRYLRAGTIRGAYKIGRTWIVERSRLEEYVTSARSARHTGMD